MGGRLPSINLDHQPDIDAWNSRAEITRLRADLETVKHQLNSAMLALVSKDGHMSVLLEQRDQWIEARETLESERAANARLTADLDASQAECERLSKALRYEEHRASHIGTHGSDCYKWGPAHYDCAVRELERVRAEVVEWEMLRDPVSLHLNLLRGMPAKLDQATFLHLAGADSLRADLAAMTQQLDRMRDLIADIKGWDVSQYMTIPHELRERMSDVLAEAPNE